MMMLFTVTLISRAEKASQDEGRGDAISPSLGLMPTPAVLPSASPESHSASDTGHGAVDDFFLEFESPESALIRQNVAIARIPNDPRKGLWVRVLVSQVFAPGRAEIDSRFIGTLDRLGALFSKWRVEVRVEASVSHDELIQRPYQNAWELSAARAAAVVARLQKKNDFIDGSLFATAVGYRQRSDENREIEFKIYDRP